MNVKAQSISISIGDELSICQQTSLNINIKNTTDVELKPSELTIKMPCGTTYITGSVTAAVEKSVNDPSLPVFTVEKIPKQANLTIKMQIKLNCEALKCLDAQQSPVFEAVLANSTTTLNYSSQSFNVQSPNLVITSIDNVYEEIPSFASRTRTINIRNSRTGKLAYCTFRHEYDQSIDVKPDVGTIIAKNNKYIEIRLDSADFVKIGNKDKWFDFNESMDINELIYVSVCYYDFQFVRSDYAISWGCENSICQKDEAIANIRILNNDDKGDKLFIYPEGVDPDCYLPGTSTQQAIFTKSPHRNALTNMTLKISQPYFDRGIVVNSVIVDPSVNIMYHEKFINECGQEVAKYMTIYIDRVPPENSRKDIKVTWETGFCEISHCETAQNAWIASYEYRKECAHEDDSYYYKEVKYKSEKLFAFNGAVNVMDENRQVLSPPLGMTNNQKGFILFTYDDARLTTSNGDTLFLTLSIPFGFELADKSFILGGKSPVLVAESTDGRNQIFKLAYILPFDNKLNKIEVPFIYRCSDVIPPEGCEGSYASCICLETVIDSISMNGIIHLDTDCPVTGHPQVCGMKPYRIYCENIKPCYKDTLPTSMHYMAGVYRTSYGLVDLDFNGIPDSMQTPSPSQYNLQHFLPGDSFNIVIQGVVNADIDGSTFKKLIFRIGHNLFISNDSLTSDFYRKLLIGPDGAITTYKTSLRIQQKSSGKIYIFDKIPQTYELGAYLLHLNADSLREYNPLTDFQANYRYSEGDSINILIFNRIDFTAYQKVNPQIKLNDFFQFTYAFHSFTGDYLPLPNFPPSPCDCNFINIYFPEFQISFPKGQAYEYNVGNPQLCPDTEYFQNLFDFSFGHIKDLPAPIGTIFPYEVRESIQPTRIELSASKDLEFGIIQIHYLGDTIDIMPEINGNKIVYDLDKKVPAAGAYFLKDPNNIMRVYLHFKPKKCINLLSPEYIDFTLHFRLNEIGKLYFPDSVSTKIRFVFPKPTISTSIYQREVTAFSNMFSTGFTLIGPKDVDEAKNVFIKLYNPSGKINSLTIADTVTNKVYVQEKGYFQLGSLYKKQLRHFKLSGSSDNCTQEILYLEYGFDCEKYENPAFTPCFRAFDTIHINFPNGLVDLKPEVSPDTTILLCDTITQKLTLLNAGLGNAFDMKIQIRLPKGLNYISGSGFIYYPAGQTITGFAIPDPIFSAPQTGEWQLKNFWPLHAENGLFGAGFFPNSEFDLTYKVLSDCEFISGLPITYKIQASTGCGTVTNRVTKNTSTFNIVDLGPTEAISINAKLETKDKCQRSISTLIISFPKPEATSSVFSVILPPEWTIVTNSITGNLTSLTPQFANNTYTWDVESSQSLIQLSFDVTNDGTELCFSDLISMFVSNQASANCLNSGTPCNVQSVIGFTSIPINSIQTSYSIEKAEIIQNNNLTILSTQLSLLSGTFYEPVNAILFIDLNGDGIKNTNENIITNLVYDGFTETNKIVRLTTELSNLTESEICNLTILIDAAENCLCNDVIYPIRLTEIYHTDKTICSGQKISLGVNEMVGTDYQWNEAIGLSCTQCPKPDFVFVNEEKIPKIFEKILTTSNSRCQSNHHYRITVNPNPEVLTQSLQICEGDTVKAISTPAFEYLWFGDNIIQNFQQELVANPSKSTTYFVTIRDAVGCTNNDSLRVEVNQKPTYIIQNDAVMCSDTSANISVNVTDTQQFVWTSGGDRLSNTTILNPNIIVFEDFIFTLELINGLCKTQVSIPVTFYKKSETTIQAEICKGESYVFDNQELTSPGKYCKISKNQFGCDSSFCLQLSIRDLPDLSSLPTQLIKEKDKDLIISGPTGYDSYQWSPPIYLSCTDCPSPTTSTNDTITYMLEVEDELGCKNRTKIKILIDDFCSYEDVYIPNAFSPNDDGTNDFYSLSGTEFCRMDFKVFNRWGNIVYEAINWNNRWNGRSGNDGVLPQGTYFIQITFDNGIVKTGMLDLRKK